MNRTDNELMISAREGDSKAFNELVLRYVDRIYGFAYRLVGETEGAEDATQETFIKVWKNRKKFNPAKSFQAWIFAIARNAAFDLLRKRKDAALSRMHESEDDENVEIEIEDVDISLPEEFDQKLLAQILEDALSVLTPDQRAAVILHDREGMTLKKRERFWASL